jgi:hypothetical protein
MKKFLLLIILFLTNCIGFTEIDTKRGWCRERINRNESEGTGGTLLLVFNCGTRSKNENETDAEYEDFKRKRAESCNNATNAAYLEFYLSTVKRNECKKKYNKYELTTHEPTASISPTSE